MMRGEAAEDGIEAPILEGQALGRSLPDRDVGEPALGRRPLDRVQHALGHVTRHDGRDMGRRAIADVAAPASEIQHPAEPRVSQQIFHLVEIVAPAVGRAVDVGLGAGCVMFGREGMLRIVHGGSPC